MILISHRGNIKGPTESVENNPQFLSLLIEQNTHIEIDLWHIDDTLYLGHNEPQYLIQQSYLEYQNFWIHAKNIEALGWLSNTNYNYFWHGRDDFTLTSHKFIWTYPNKSITKQSVIVCQNLTDTHKYLASNAYGICSDYIEIPEV